MKDRKPREPDDLRDQLREQLHFLKTSAAAFDQGHTHEAKRLALALRILCHDSRHSAGLLGQLGLRASRHYLDSAAPITSHNLMPQCHLVGLFQDQRGRARFAAMLDDTSMRFTLFDAWWYAEVLWDRVNPPFTRDQLVRHIADTDGGAHVDRALDAAYQALRDGSLGWSQDGPPATLKNPERYAVRQIAHEMIKSLDPNYSRRPRLGSGTFLHGFMVMDASIPVPPPLSHYADDDPEGPCGCRSGRPFSQCHAAGALIRPQGAPST